MHSLSSSSLLAALLIFAFHVHAQQNPVANAGPDQSLAAGPNCQTAVTLDGSLSSDPDGDTLTYTWAGHFAEGGGIATGVKPTVTFEDGVHNVLLVVDDGHGGLATDTVQITVKDMTPPVISGISATPNVLWPPNHKFISVTVAPNVTDNCDPNPVCKIISITSNEVPSTHGNGNGNGNGNGHGHDKDEVTGDFVITGPLTADLRAERMGGSSGRTYTITIQCTDKSGNSSIGTVTVNVPHDQRNKRRSATGQF